MVESSYPPIREIIGRDIECLLRGRDRAFRGPIKRINHVTNPDGDTVLWSAETYWMAIKTETVWSLYAGPLPDQEEGWLILSDSYGRFRFVEDPDGSMTHSDFFWEYIKIHAPGDNLKLEELPR